MAAPMMNERITFGDDVHDARKLPEEEHEDSGDETTPTTTASELSECSDLPRVDTDDDLESMPRDADSAETETESGEMEEYEPTVERQLGPGLFDEDLRTDHSRPDVSCCESLVPPASAPVVPEACDVATGAPSAGASSEPFTPQETLFVFDWDDTVLPSSWIQRQGLRLDAGSFVHPWQQEKLAEVAEAAAETIRLAKQHGTVVLLTNAERGWIELSCQKFLPTLLPSIEGVKIVSARTTYESPWCTSPLDWKVRAFEAEIARACGAETLVDPSKRKNIHSLGDSVHEREALMRACARLPACRTKSLKFVERPDISQILKQHHLVTQCFDQIVQHDEHLDLAINCS